MIVIVSVSSVATKTTFLAEAHYRALEYATFAVRHSSQTTTRSHQWKLYLNHLISPNILPNVLL